MHDQHFDERIKSKLLMLWIPFKDIEWELFKKRLEPPLDLLVREHLAQFEDPQLEDDWSIFEEKLVKETFSINTNILNTEITDLNNNQPSSAYDQYIPDDFDHNLAQSLDPTIQNALNDFEASYDQEDWELFSVQFHGAFDTSIQKQLEDYEATYNMLHWQHMAEQLNLPFYAAIKAKFTDYQVPFRRSDWWRMSLRLRQRKFVDSPVLLKIPASAYGVAAAILLLFALNLFTFLPRNGVLTPVVAETNIAMNQSDKLEREVITQNQILPIQTNTRLEEEKADKGLDHQKGQNLQAENQLIAESNSASSLNTVVPDNYSSELVANISPREQSLEIPYVPAESQILASEAEEGLITSGKSLKTNNSQYNYYRALTSETNNSEVRPILLDDKNISIGNGISGFSKDQIDQFYASNSSINPEIRLGFLGGFNSSVAELTTRGRMGYQVGLRLEMAFNDEWSVISGLVYNQKEYQHKYLSLNTKHTLLDAKFKTVEIPLLVRHTFPPYGKTSLYIQSGIVMMISMEEFYLIFDPNSVANLGVENRRDLAPKNQLLNFRTYVGNVHSAMGLQYELSENINLQLEPYFQLGLQRMGSEGKKLYSAGVNFGAVYRIGKKGS